MELNIAQCCGTCIWANSANTKKKDIETHAAHYTVAKTERWCLKFNIPTVREAICNSGYEIDNKKGGTPAVKRARSQNLRLEKIIKVKEYIKAYGTISFSGRTYKVDSDRLVYTYDGSSYQTNYNVNCKENSHDEILNKYSSGS